MENLNQATRLSGDHVQLNMHRQKNRNDHSVFCRFFSVLMEINTHISICGLTFLKHRVAVDKITSCNVQGGACSDQLTDIYHLTVQFPQLYGAF